MLFANDGMWEFFKTFSAQAPGIAALLIAFGIALAMVLFFLWKLVTRYADQGMNAARGLIVHLNSTSDKIDALVSSNACIPGLASDVKKVATKVEKVADKIADWPSDFPEKLEEAKCTASEKCHFPMMSLEEAREFLGKKKAEKTNG